jgi:enamine deaminase RidA (YjgF/YER057c/UK114 family)
MNTTLTSHPWDDRLPTAPAPVAAYVPVRSHRQGDMLTLLTSGMLPMVDGKLAFVGKVGGSGLALEQASQAARQCVLNGLAALKAELGSLAAIEQVLKVTVFVASNDGFDQQPQVANGASHALVEVLGDAIGRHARSAVGVAMLPLNAPVEVELTVVAGSL